MNSLKTGLVCSLGLITLAIVFLQYDLAEVSTVKDALIIPAFIINFTLVLKLLSPKKQVAK